MRITLISVVALLGLLFPQMLLAGEEPQEFTMTPRAQKIIDQAPKTPEELLRVIKDFMDNPNVNGYEFAEKIIGAEREKWGPATVYSNPPHKDYSPNYHLENNGFAFQTFFKVSSVFIAPSESLYRMVIRFDRKHKIESCVTAELIQQIIGQPYYLRRKHWHDGPPYIYYLYKTEDYRLDLIFSFPSDLKATRKVAEDFGYHKDFCASRLRFGTYEGKVWNN